MKRKKNSNQVIYHKLPFFSSNLSREWKSEIRDEKEATGVQTRTLYKRHAHSHPLTEDESITRCECE